jgi:hypothetical protein
MFDILLRKARRATLEHGNKHLIGRDLSRTFPAMSLFQHNEPFGGALRARAT